MSIFDNIVFDEFTLLEGKQAIAYRDRKDLEKVKKAEEDVKYQKNLSRRMDYYNKNNPDALNKAASKYFDEKENRKKKFDKSVEDSKAAASKAKKDFDDFKTKKKDDSISKKDKIAAAKKAKTSIDDFSEKNKKSHEAHSNYKNIENNVGNAVMASIKRDRRTKHESVFSNIEMI